MTAMGVRVVLCALFAAHSVLAEEGLPSTTPPPTSGTTIQQLCASYPTSRFVDSTNTCFFEPFIVDFRVNFEEGELTCKQVHSKANLASIRSQEENDAVTEMSQEYLQGQYPVGVWIGGSEPSTEAVWSWSDGADFEFTNWHENQPNNWNGDQHCAVLWKTDGTWQDIACTEDRMPICALRLQDFHADFHDDDEADPGPQTAFSATCAELGGEVIGDGCFFLGDNEVKWNDGNRECEAKNSNATLATIYSRDENELVKRISEQYLHFRTRGEALIEDNGVWIGANDQIVEGEWMWFFGYSLGFGYNQWAEGHPTAPTAFQLTDADCGAMARADGAWVEVECSRLKRPACVIRSGDQTSTLPHYELYKNGGMTVELLKETDAAVVELHAHVLKLVPAAEALCASLSFECERFSLQHSCDDYASYCLWRGDQ